jgi:hypothetical protein
MLADWLEDHGDTRADAVRRVLRWRAAERDTRAEEVPDDCEDAVALQRSTALALGEADPRLWACACLRRLPLLEGGDGPALLADRRRCVVAAAELFASGLLGADGLRAARAGRGWATTSAVGRPRPTPAMSSSGRWPSRTWAGRTVSCWARPSSSWAPTAAASSAAPCWPAALSPPPTGCCGRGVAGGLGRAARPAATRHFP